MSAPVQGGYRRKSADEVRADIRKRSSLIDREYLDLGKDLYVAKYCEHYIKWGYATWRDYIGSEPGLSVKRDERLRKVWKTLVKSLGAKPDDLHKIGFSKASLLCRDGLLTRENLEDWLADARNMSFRELEKAVKAKGKKKVTTKEVDEVDDEGKATGKKKTVRVVTGEDGGESEFESITFSLTEDQKDVVSEALSKAELLADSNKRGYLLHLICTDFLAGNLGEDPKERRRLRFHLSNLEEAFGVRVMALPEGDEATKAITAFVESRPDLFDAPWDDPEVDED